MPDEPIKRSRQPAGKVFDVVRPGNTAASANSRPTIIGHQPHIQDDQLVSERASNPSSDTSTLLTHHEATIETTVPDHDDANGTLSPPPVSGPAVPTEPVVEEQTAAPVEQETEPEAVPQVSSEGDKETDPQTNPSEPSHLAVGHTAVMESTSSAEPAPAPMTGITTGQAIISDHKTKSKTGKRLLIFLLIIILLVVVADILLDAGIIKTTLNLPHTHFITKG
jgi:hypothetical protein